MTSVESVQVEISPDSSQARVHFKQLSYSDFGSSGTLMHHAVSRLMESACAYALNNGFLDHGDVFESCYTLYLIGLQYVFSPALWSVKWDRTFPFEIHLQVIDVGETSVTMEEKLINKLDQKVLVTVHTKMVNIDRATKRSAPFQAGSAMTKCRSAITSPRPLLLSRDIPQIPASAYIFEVVVAESDLDWNKHCNQSQYIRFCLDGTHVAVKKGRVSRFQPTLWEFPLLNLEVVFIQESLMGDRLLVFLWQQEANRDAMRYVIKVQKDGKQSAIFLATMLFGQSATISSNL